VAGRVITVTSGKGGVGKTTFSANVSAALAELGKKAVAVDTDVGLRNLDIVMGLENRIVFDLIDVVEGRCRLQKAIIRDKRIPTLHMLPAAQTRDKSAVSPDAMEKICAELRSQFDFTIIDSPAGIEGGFQNAIAGADEVVIVTTPHVSAIRDADRVIGLLEAAEKQQIYLVINRLQAEMVRRALRAADERQNLAVGLDQRKIGLPVAAVDCKHERPAHPTGSRDSNCGRYSWPAVKSSVVRRSARGA